MKKFNLSGLWTILKQTFSGCSDDKIFKLSASLAYYTVFSLGPMFIVIIYLADIFWGRQAIEGTIYAQFRSFVGSDAAAQLQQIIKNSSLSNKSNATAIIGFITLILGATSVFAEIQDSINMIWGLKAKPKKGWLKMLINRLLSFSVIVSLGFLMIVSLLINGLLEAFMDHLKQIFPNLAIIFVYSINLLLTFFVITFLFGIIFKVLPDAKIKWKDVLIGATSTAFLFMIGKFAITFYIGTSNIGGTYGTAGSTIVLLLWVYYSAVILYFGAEFTKAYACNYGTRIYPNQYAVWTKQIEIEQKKGSLQEQEQKKEVIKK